MRSVHNNQIHPHKVHINRLKPADSRRAFGEFDSSAKRVSSVSENLLENPQPPTCTADKEVALPIVTADKETALPTVPADTETALPTYTTNTDGTAANNTLNQFAQTSRDAEHNLTNEQQCATASQQDKGEKF